MSRVTRTSTRRNRGFFVLDILAGLALLIALASVLAVTMTKHSAATRRLGEQRAAHRAAEAALVALQSGQPAAAGVDGVSMIVTTLDSPAPMGWRWVRVELKSVNADGRETRSSLVGVVPEASTKGGGS